MNITTYKTKHIPLLTGSFYFSFFIGIFNTIRGIFMPAIKDHFSMNNTQTALILLTFLVPGVAGCLYSGYVFNIYNKKKLLILGAVILSLFAVLLPLSEYYSLFLFISFVMGFGIIIVEVGAFIAVPDVFTIQAPKYKEAAVNSMHFIFSLGSVLTLLLFSNIPENQLPSWQYAYIVVGAISLIIPVSFILSTYPSVTTSFKKSEYTVNRFVTIFKDPQMTRYFVLGALYVGTEIGIASWLPMYYIKGYGESTTYAAKALLIFFGFFTAGRLLGSVISKQLNNHRLIIALISSAAITSAIGLLFRFTLFDIEIFIPLCGFCISMLFPTFQNYMISDFKNELNTATSIFMAGGSLGGTILAFLIGPLNDIMHEKFGLTIIIVYTVAMIPLFRSTVYYSKNKKKVLLQSNISQAF